MLDLYFITHLRLSLYQFQQKLEAKQEEERQLANQNQSMLEELELKTKELETYEANHAQLKALQDELTLKHRSEIEHYKENEAELQKEVRKNPFTFFFTLLRVCLEYYVSFLEYVFTKSFFYSVFKDRRGPFIFGFTSCI